LRSETQKLRKVFLQEFIGGERHPCDRPAYLPLVGGQSSKKGQIGRPV